MVPACSVKVPRVSTYSGYRHVNSSFAYGAFTLSGRLSQYRSGNSEYNLLQSLTLQCTHRSLGSFPFARRYSGNHFCFLFLRVLRCFSSPSSSRDTYVFGIRCHPSWMTGSPIRISADLCFLTAPRSVSPFGASFFSPRWPGIHRTPFPT